MEDKLNYIIERIVEIVDPDVILLFGSRATGNDTEDSDLDLLIIKSNLNESRKLLKKLYSSISGIGIPLDMIMVDRETLYAHQDDPYLIYGQALKEGRTLYAKA